MSILSLSRVSVYIIYIVLLSNVSEVLKRWVLWQGINFLVFILLSLDNSGITHHLINALLAESISALFFTLIHSWHVDIFSAASADVTRMADSAVLSHLV